MATDAPQTMTWLGFVLLTVASWGVYGLFLHSGQMQMGDPINGRYKAFLFVGIAYFLTAVLAPLALLAARVFVVVARRAVLGRLVVLDAEHALEPVAPRAHPGQHEDGPRHVAAAHGDCVSQHANGRSGGLELRNRGPAWNDGHVRNQEHGPGTLGEIGRPVCDYAIVRRNKPWRSFNQRVGVMFL